MWRLAEAAYGQAGPGGRKASRRVTSLARGVFYALVCAGVVGLVAGSGGPAPGNRQSEDLTARLMSHAGGRWLVLLIGLGVVAAGIGMVVTGVRRKFLRQLRLAGMSSRTRKIVETLGTVGNTAGGIVIGVVGVLLVVAAVTFDPKKAQGLDGALRRIARTPLGTWLPRWLPHPAHAPPPAAPRACHRVQSGSVTRSRDPYGQNRMIVQCQPNGRSGPRQRAGHSDRGRGEVGESEPGSCGRGSAG